MRPSCPIVPLEMDRVMDRLWDPQRRHALAPVDLCAGSSRLDVSEHIDLDELRAALPASLAYGDPLGMPELRRAIADHYGEVYGAQVSPAQICITDGASGALIAALVALVEPGDEIIIPEVCFPPYRILIQMLRGVCVPARLNAGRTYDLDSVRSLVGPRTRAILVNSPSNPYGSVTSRAELEALVDLGLPVIADEVYHLLADRPPTSLAELGLDHWVVNSFSKSFAMAGHRLGYLIAPLRAMELIRNIKATVNVCTSQPAQLFALQLLRARRAIAAGHRARLAEGRQLLSSWARARGSTLDLSLPEVGFFALLDVTDSLDGGGTAGLAFRLLDAANVGVAPGVDFAPWDPGFVRINFSAPPALLAEGCRRLDRFLAATRRQPIALAGG